VTWVAVAVGGALGSSARHLVNLLVSQRLGAATPYATFLVNVSGCLVIGALAGAIAGERLHMTPLVRTFVFVGLLGGFTTFSSFGLDTVTLLRNGQHAAAFWNATGQLSLGLAAVSAGFTIAR
jgi:CrcB protein